MLSTLPAQPADALLALIKLYAADNRADKIDLGVGVYRTGDGATPVFAAVKGAERKLVETQDSKAYLGPEGDMGFVNALKPYIFGQDFAAIDRIDGMQTPGGTGGVRVAVAMAKAAGVTRVILGNPSWPNHAQILKDLDLGVVTFNHARDGAVDMDALKAAIAEAGPTDAILLHGCCHNPTGIDYSVEQWREIAGLLKDKGLLPILDLAYQGLGFGMEEDAQGVRIVMATVPEALLAYSCDKNFGLYRDRVGAFYVLAADRDQLPAIMSNAASLARANWSMPPDHGGATVRIILEDADLTKQWLGELEDMRARMRTVRDRLAAAGTAGSVDMTPYGTQSGLFAMLPLSKEQIQALRDEHAVYMAGSGRINVAGLTTGNIEKFIDAVASVSA